MKSTCPSSSLPTLAYHDISASPELGAILEPDGTVAIAMSPPAFAARVKEELAQWKQIATEHKIVAE